MWLRLREPRAGELSWDQSRSCLLLLLDFLCWILAAWQVNLFTSRRVATICGLVWVISFHTIELIRDRFSGLSYPSFVSSNHFVWILSGVGSKLGFQGDQRERRRGW